MKQRSHESTPRQRGEQEQGQPESHQRRDWAWRRRIRSRRHSYQIYRIVIGVVGTAITIIGVITIPAPGPGWAIVFLGLAVLASEFVWAQRLRNSATRHVRRWTEWLVRQPYLVRGVVAAGTCALVVAICYGFLVWRGVPIWIPDVLWSWLPGLYAAD